MDTLSFMQMLRAHHDVTCRWGKQCFYRDRHAMSLQSLDTTEEPACPRSR